KTIIFTSHQVEEIEHILTDVMFIRDGKVVLDAPMEDLGERFVEVLVDANQAEAARQLGPLDERSLPFGKTVMLFDGVSQAALSPYGQTRTPGLADLFVATMKGTYAGTSSPIPCPRPRARPRGSRRHAASAGCCAASSGNTAAASSGRRWSPGRPPWCCRRWASCWRW